MTMQHHSLGPVKGREMLDEAPSGLSPQELWIERGVIVLSVLTVMAILYLVGRWVLGN